jgi:hypothetical protein
VELVDFPSSISSNLTSKIPAYCCKMLAVMCENFVKSELKITNFITCKINGFAMMARQHLQRSCNTEQSNVRLKGIQLRTTSTLL